MSKQTKPHSQGGHFSLRPSCETLIFHIMSVISGHLVLSRMSTETFGPCQTVFEIWSHQKCPREALINLAQWLGVTSQSERLLPV